MSKKHPAIPSKMPESKIKIPKKCNQEKCSMFTKVLFSRCALNPECFRECKKSGYKKHFEEVK